MKKLKNYEFNFFLTQKERNCGKQTQQLSQHQTSRQNIRHQKFLSKHQIWCYNIRYDFKTSEVSTLLGNAWKHLGSKPTTHFPT